jgi:hypothetical protein
MNEAPHDDLIDIARLAYIYGFPPYEMARLRFQAVGRPHQGQTMRLNAFRHDRALTSPTSGRVTTTNADMLKSNAWLDLGQSPLVIRVPNTAGRYYSLALMDCFTNNFTVLGPRRTGAAAGDFFLAGPQWNGDAPVGMTLLRAPTNAVWALVRILVHGPDDLAAVRELQEGFTISAPLGHALSPAPPGPDPHPPAMSPFDDSKPLKFFDVLNVVLTENPPLPQDQPVLDRLRTIGVGPSLKFKRRDFTPAQLHALRQGLASAREALHRPRQAGPTRWPSDALLARLRGPVDGSQGARQGARRTGWTFPDATVGNFAADYVLRARCALRGIGGLPCEEAMYFIATTDASGARLGGGRYVLRFPPGGTPPADAYWSLTAYWTDENNRRWLVPNEVGRYSIGNHQPGLRYAEDGSLKILIQHDRPAASAENWLPAPEGRFVLTLRAYQPKPELLEGRYVIPEVRRRPGFG